METMNLQKALEIIHNESNWYKVTNAVNFIPHWFDYETDSEAANAAFSAKCAIYNLCDTMRIAYIIPQCAKQGAINAARDTAAMAVVAAFEAIE